MLKDETKAKRLSIGELIRNACEKQYGLSSESEALEAAERLSALNLPVGTPVAMKQESVLNPEES